MIDTNSWRGRRVFVTGHTGFKGSWLALWLHQLGASVTGFALPPPTNPSLFDGANIGELITSIEGDIRDLDAVSAAMTEAQPEVVFHLAAQPLVRASYENPVETYATNVMGTVHLLEAARNTKSARAFVCITTDKCYENREWVWPYREADPMGGHDPYSSSKGCAELVVSAYRRSFFNEDGSLALASVRAGNVIGGGDYALDRLIPDLIRSFLKQETPVIRSPKAVRPWQHVLEALGGYLLIAERLLDGSPNVADAWNFGPADDDAQPVDWIVSRMRHVWGDGAHAPTPFLGQTPHEAGLLRLDISKARAQLGWRPSLRLIDALDWIVEWHRAVESGAHPREVTLEQIARYSALYQHSS
ncbi:CDP-glucose 4,6-dehydratase [Novosphingobium sp. APW14]|uniref:CDP-glucose 4,6-dehydratase n=1 Tax=Novosphingobium sp. APW14 TaxID=3077237 RepID=UPI0028DF275A|nr:CDP-glucose 4,6-dehydratase [Novosphingobium sp. APW14]MDT9013645.1 CDP-glucose 4,6-dehydratase [Novosphingobium sp. APW14]